MLCSKIIALTMGDPGGIGPEVILKALNHDSIKQLRTQSAIIVIGHQTVLEDTARALNIDDSLRVIAEKDIRELKAGAYLLAIETQNLKIPAVHNPVPGNGQASLDYLLKAIDLASQQVINGIVTAPVSKQAINLAGHQFTGHTEFLAQKTKTRKPVMMFVLDNLSADEAGLKVALVTTHLAYKKVPLHLNADNILSTITVVDKSLKQYFGLLQPRIGVCGLNPHAGEDGLFGQEEKTIITPAIELAKKQKIIASGPFPADGIFRMALMGELDAIVALYHDQAMIPVKTLGYRVEKKRVIGFNPAVNVTLGLPFIRTSVAHGTAFDIVGQNRAQSDSLINALKLAYQMSLNQPELF